MIVDIRRFPGSRRHPHFSRDEMGKWLAVRGVDYCWLPSLGGRRRPIPDSPNVALRHDQFRGYADHMASPEFRSAVAELLDLPASGRPAAVLCAESLWWRCHRRLLADHLVLVAHLPVEHLFHDGRLAAHRPSPEARVADGHLVYDVTPQGQLFTDNQLL